jgi:hypothetical protein
LIVGSAGILTCIVLGVVAFGDYLLLDREFGLPDPPIVALVGVALYASCANVCLSVGWLVELIVRKIWVSRSRPIRNLELVARFDIFWVTNFDSGDSYRRRVSLRSYQTSSGGDPQ